MPFSMWSRSQCLPHERLFTNLLTGLWNMTIASHTLCSCAVAYKRRGSAANTKDVSRQAVNSPPVSDTPSSASHIQGGQVHHSMPTPSAASAPADGASQTGYVKREQAIAIVAAAVEEAVVSAGGKIHVDLKHPQVPCIFFGSQQL